MGNKQSFTTVFILNLTIMTIYSIAVRWHLFINMAKLACVVLLYVMMLIVLPLLAYKSEHVSQFVNGSYDSFLCCLKSIYSKRKKIFIRFFLYILIAIIAVIGTKLVFNMIGQQVNEMITYLVIGLSLLTATVIFLRKEIGNKPEKLFFSCAIIIGITFIMATPNTSIQSWDDGVHYIRTVSLANFADETGYEADQIFLYDSANTTFVNEDYTKEYRIEYNKRINDSFSRRKTGTLYRDFGLYSICYIPEAAGMILGRAINLPFTWILKLARFFNLLFYSSIVYLAIKKLKFGKVLVASLALIPTTIYMACCFSYDPWVTCLIVYGFCSFFGFLQDRDKKMTKQDMFFMLLAFVLGCIPKAIYFIIMFPLFLIPKTSFNTKREYKEFMLWLLISGLFLASTFLFPMLINGAGTGDIRGGSDVNSTEQIKFILTSPGSFISIMVRFLSEYLFIGNSPGFTVLFGWLGSGFIGKQATFIVIIIVAILDREGIKSKNATMIIITMISFVLDVFFIATALYISYTPVGYNTVNGCQHRYLIPILFPLLYVIFPDKKYSKINKPLFNSVPMLFMSFIFLSNTMLLMAKYF